MKRNPLLMLTWSSLKAYVRNRGAIFFSLLVPLMILAIFGVINFNSAVSVDIGVVDRAQNPVSQPITVGSAVVSGSLRSRTYSWNWFGDTADGDYTYPGSLLRVSVAHSKTKLDWQLEAAVPVLVNLPQTAIAPAPRGQLGLGANYFAANDNSRNAAGFSSSKAPFASKASPGSRDNR